MKRVISIFSVLAIAFTLALTSCKKNEPQNTFTGHWEVSAATVNGTTYTKEDLEAAIIDPSTPMNMRIVLSIIKNIKVDVKEDNTFSLYETGSKQITGTWTINGNNVTFTPDDKSLETINGTWNKENNTASFNISYEGITTTIVFTKVN